MLLKRRWVHLHFCRNEVALLSFLTIDKIKHPCWCLISEKLPPINGQFVSCWSLFLQPRNTNLWHTAQPLMEISKKALQKAIRHPEPLSAVQPPLAKCHSERAERSRRRSRRISSACLLCLVPELHLGTPLLLAKLHFAQTLLLISALSFQLFRPTPPFNPCI